MFWIVEVVYEEIDVVVVVCYGCGDGVYGGEDCVLLYGGGFGVGDCFE